MSDRPQDDAPDYAGGGLSRETNWWGAFVIGLAGTILVTGIAPVMVTSLGAAAIPLIIIITLSGYLLCLFLAELSAMMPERAGGSPTYAYVGFKDKWPRLAEHVNGFSCWAYWLGWFPVGAAEHDPGVVLHRRRCLVSTSTNTFTPIHTPIAYWTVVIAIAGILHRVHSGVAGHPPGSDLRDHPRPDLDGAVDAFGDRADLLPLQGRLGPAVGLQAPGRHRRSSARSWVTTGSRSTSRSRSCSPGT